MRKSHADLVGMIFNNYTVLSFSHKKSNGVPMWFCRCDCGYERAVSSYELVRLKYKHCTKCRPVGSGKNANRWNGYEGIMGSVWYDINYAAKQRGLEVGIDIKYIWALYLSQNGKCALSGLAITLPSNSKDRVVGNFTASLDRIDCKVAYLKNNLQWVHKTINLMKNVLSDTEFIAFCTEVANYQRDKHAT